MLLFIPLLIQHTVVGKHHIDRKKKNNRAIFFFFVFLTVLIALRHESVGNDTRNYIHFFGQYSKLSWQQLWAKSAEVGFAYYNRIISFFTKEPQVFLAITAAAIVAMMYPTYKRLCVDASLTIVLFCIMSTFVMMFSGLRQMLAVGMGFIAYEYTRQKKLLPFVLIVLLAITFHTSAFMLAFMYPLYHAKITKKWLLIVVPAIVLVFVLNRQIFSILSLFIERYTRYEGSITQTGAYAMIALFAIFAVIAFLVPDETKLDAEIIGLRNFLLLALVLQMFAPLHSLAMRMNYYYIVFVPLLLPKIIECRSIRWNRVAIIGRHIMVAFFLWYFFFIKANSEGNLHAFPYHFFWEQV